MQKRHAVITGLSLIIFASGFGLRVAMRPSVEELELDATLALNRGAIPEAELLARQILGRSPASKRARTILTQIALSDNRPLLHVAVLLSIPASDPRGAEARFRAGEIALQHNHAVVAEQCWRDHLKLDPASSRSYDRLISLAGLRLDHNAVHEFVTLRQKHFGLDSATIRLFLSSQSLDGRDASSVEGLLRAFVKTNPGDLKSRFGLARCLNILGRPEDARKVLSGYVESPLSRVLLARAESDVGNLKAAHALLPDSPPQAAVGDYWLVTGLLHLREGHPDRAVIALEKSVAAQPLNREIRSRYSEALREQNNTTENGRQAKMIDIQRKIESFAKSSIQDLNLTALDELITQCEMIDAKEHARVLRETAQRMRTR